MLLVTLAFVHDSISIMKLIFINRERREPLSWLLYGPIKNILKGHYNLNIDVSLIMFSLSRDIIIYLHV